MLKINNVKINWESEESHYFFNPHHPQANHLKSLARKLPFLKGHIYLFTSSLGKICLLSKSAILESALSVNKNLQTHKKDKWLISLPLFHIAGLSILARSFCGHFSHKKFLKKWIPLDFQKELKDKRITLCSLVPAQIYDLVQQKMKAPSSLKAVLVGGGALSPLLYKKARKLGWPLLPSYGLTEASSQVACASLNSLKQHSFPQMKILDHIQIKTAKSQVKIKSKSLLTAYYDISKNRLLDPKDSKGFFELPDKILLKKDSLYVQGRKEEEIKILGERVSLKALSFLLEKKAEKLFGEHQLLPVPELRQGFQLVLMTTCFNFPKVFSLVKSFNSQVLPFEKIKSIYFVSEIPKSSLFKTSQKLLLSQLYF